jgi:hypothetical protein
VRMMWLGSTGGGWWVSHHALTSRLSRGGPGLTLASNSLMNTVLTVNGIPFASTFVLSNASSISYVVAIDLSLSPMIGNSR